MSNNSEKLIYEADGTYHTGDIASLDLKQGSATEPKPVSLSDLAKSASNTATQPAPKSAPKAGSFSLADLRNSASKVASTVSTTELPPKDEDVKNFKTEAIDKTNTAPEPATPAPVSASAPAPAAEVPAPKVTVEIEPEPVVEPEPEPVSAEPAKPVSIAELRLQSSASNTTTAEESKAKADTTFTPANMGLEKSTPASAPVDVNNLTEEQREAEAEFSGNGFTAMPFDDWRKLVQLSEYGLFTWAQKCLNRAVSAPSAIFAMKGEENVRFYNFILGNTGNKVPVVLGYGDHLTCAMLDFKSKKIYAADGRIVACNGDMKADTGDFMALYNEKLREAVVV